MLNNKMREIGECIPVAIPPRVALWQFIVPSFYPAILNIPTPCSAFLPVACHFQLNFICHQNYRAGTPLNISKV